MTYARDYTKLGPCAFCGYPDAGHRVWDTIAERLRAGETERSVAGDYDLTIQGVRALARRSDTASGPDGNRFSARKHRTSNDTQEGT